MKTGLIKFRYNPKDGSGSVSQVVDGLNDIIGSIAHRFKLDILSISHVCGTSPNRTSSFSSTVVCLLNGHSIEDIAKALEAENSMNDRIMYCFREAHKLSINVYKISYN